MKYGIRLVSKYTGDSVAILGYQFDSIKEATRYFDSEVCSRCNRMENVYIEDGQEWINKEDGFVFMQNEKSVQRDGQYKKENR